MTGEINDKSNPFLTWNNLDDSTKIKKTYLKHPANTILKNADYFFKDDNTTEAVKISRRKYPFLEHSYTITRDLNTKEVQVFEHFHGKDATGKRNGFVGKGRYKVILEMKNKTGNRDAVRALLIEEIVYSSLKQFIGELALSKYVLIPKYMKWVSEKTNVVKEALVSEKMDQDLLSYIQAKKQSHKQIIKILLQIAKGVKEMHDKNWIHQDLKPENILIKGKKLKIADLDMVEQVIDGASITYAGTAMFKPPEAFLKLTNTVKAAKKVEIYSLGGTFYEIYKREAFHVFTKFQDGHRVVIVDKTERDHLFLEPIHKTGLTYLIWRMTRYNPDERPTIEQVIKFLEGDLSALPKIEQSITASKELNL